MSEEVVPDAPQVPDVPERGATPSRKKSRNRLFLPLITTGVITVVALVAVVLVSVTRASETAELRAALESEQERVDGLGSQLATYKDRELDVIEREGAVDSQEAELDQREAAISATEEHIAATTLKDGYVYTVGSTMEAGTYQANATGGTCYWKITVSGTNYSDIVENDLGKNGVIAVAVGPGQDFQSERCGDWTKVG
ncbi:hypothetical protein J7E25_13510 [Agromyces sp. ISL-38]|uniref:hypothetical protein n=1 Tax=Agromyces sp. ISL-38 TaxID=2819107 RepID=UPI001BE91A00|nr:hypothetical protein [Agromyces sp. ISL-38]MBT2500104.1 hypothetical protein [Agromyces sp. ISL-38]